MCVSMSGSIVVELLLVLSACMYPLHGMEKDEILNAIVRSEVADLRQDAIYRSIYMIAFFDILPVSGAGTIELQNLRSWLKRKEYRGRTSYPLENGRKTGIDGGCGERELMQNQPGTD